MNCPHCTKSIHFEESQRSLGKDSDGDWSARVGHCPACSKLIIYLVTTRTVAGTRGTDASINELSRRLIRPKAISRNPVNSDVPQQYRSDYEEACLVLTDSPKASAALSRRCLQSIIQNVAGITKPNLSQEIQALLDSKTLPSHIAESLDSIRVIGNFAAHPTKSQASGEIVEVEIGEAEWNLEVIESLFDFYFVQPAKTKAKIDAMNAKLKDAGKPPMK